MLQSATPWCRILCLQCGVYGWVFLTSRRQVAPLSPGYPVQFWPSTDTSDQLSSLRCRVCFDPGWDSPEFAVTIVHSDPWMTRETDNQQVVAAGLTFAHVTFDVFAQFLRQHTMSVLFTFNPGVDGDGHTHH